MLLLLLFVITIQASCVSKETMDLGLCENYIDYMNIYSTDKEQTISTHNLIVNMLIGNIEKYQSIFTLPLICSLNFPMCKNNKALPICRNNCTNILYYNRNANYYCEIIPTTTDGNCTPLHFLNSGAVAEAVASNFIIIICFLLF